MWDRDEIWARQAIRDAILGVLSEYNYELSKELASVEKDAEEIGKLADRILELNPENEEIRKAAMLIKERAERIVRMWLERAYNQMKYTEKRLADGWLYDLFGL